MLVIYYYMVWILNGANALVCLKVYIDVNIFVQPFQTLR